MSDLIKQLKAAKTDEDREWLVMKFSLENLETAVREAVWAAAIPRWFDQRFLAALLEKEMNEEFVQIFDKLLECSFVEIFPGRGYNIHERSRDLLLKRLSKERPDVYRKLNKRAAEYCANQDVSDPGWQVARIYHVLLSGEQTAVSEFTAQGTSWYNRCQYDRLETLARPVITESKMGRMSPSATAWAYHFQGMSDYMYSRFESAKNNFALGLSSYSDDRELTAHNLSYLGEAHMQLGQFSEAKDRIEQARRIYRDISDRLNEANSIFRIGEILRYTGAVEDANQRFEEAGALYKEVGDELGEANCKLVLGDFHIHFKRYDKARVNFTEALQTFRDKGSNESAASCLKSLGDLAVEIGQYDQARSQYEQSLSLSRQTGGRLAEATALAKMGRLLAIKGEVREARTTIGEALEIYRQIGSKLGEQNCLSWLEGINQMEEPES